MKSSTAVATAEKETVAPLPRKGPVVDANSVAVDWSGQGRSSLMVRLPKDAIADDLKEPGLWLKVQRSNKALRSWDALFLVAFDQSWAAEAIVSCADDQGVTLCGIRIIPSPQKSKTLFRDSKYAIAWSGRGYYVERIADGQRCTQDTHSEQLAINDLKQQYPQTPGF